MDMEVSVSTLPYSFLAIVLALWLFLQLRTTSCYKILSTNKRPKQLQQPPPGPWTLPVIGSLHHVLLSRQPPHRRLTELSRRNDWPVMSLQLGEVPAVVVSSAEAAEAVMRGEDLALASRPRGVTLDIIGNGAGMGIIFAPYGGSWQQARKLCVVELLSAKQVRRVESIRSEEVGRHLVNNSNRGGVVNLTEKLAALANDIIARAVFGPGKCGEQQGEYLRELEKVTALVSGFSAVDLFPSWKLVRLLGSGERRMRRSYGRIRRIIQGIIRRRKEVRASAAATAGSREEDFLDVLLRLQEEDSLAFPLTSEAIGVIIFDMFAGATETSGMTIEWAMSELLKNPRAMAKAQLEVRKVLGQQRGVITNNDLGELHYTRMVIKEVLRLHPPAPLLPRRAREDCEIMGYTIPKGTNVHVNVFAISRDSRYWDDPEAFEPERFENGNIDYKGTHFEFTPFGAGRRQCPGMLFGMSTVEIALANLLYHFDWAIPDGASSESLDMSEKFGINVRRRLAADRYPLCALQSYVDMDMRGLHVFFSCNSLVVCTFDVLTGP